MRDLGTKMAELKFEAPLAKFEESDEWGGCDFITSSHHHHHHQQQQQHHQQHHHQQQQQQHHHHHHHHHHHIHHQQSQQQQQHRHRHQLQSSLNDALNLNIKDASTTQDVKLRLLEEAVRDAHVSRNGSDAVKLCVNANVNGNVNGNGNDNANVGIGIGSGVSINANNTTTTGGDGGSSSGSISPNCNTQFGGDLNGGGVGGGGGGGGGGSCFELAAAITGVDVTADRRVIDNVDNFTETFGGSLEDLVNTFDEKITKCFGNYEENVEELAPVQVRSQEEIMNECQMWWTITGNFGNILPIDWSKSYTRQMHMPTLNLGNKMKTTTTNGSMNSQNENGHDGGGGCGGNEGGGNGVDELNDLSSEDEAVANDLDMHALILNGMAGDGDEPIKTVEEVIKEIDDIMDEAESPIDETETCCDTEVMEKAKEVLGASLHAEKLQYLTIVQLNELFMEMEMLIQEFSETLINELALRDELEYEKELKNTFISLLLAVQNKRRQYHVEKKRGKLQGAEPKYLTTVIPYHLENGTPNNQSLQVLIKILKAINEDSPAVPALLTDYILKVLCPTT